MKAIFSRYLLVLLNLAIALPLKAQIVPDGTTNTIIDSTNNGRSIEAGDRAGNNLFHSFQEFSIPNGSTVLFNNPEGIVNVFSRVTGGNISNIEGLLRVNGDANLFLINPAGIIFGEGATLDIGGSFVATTAESIVFRDNVEFSATDGDNAPLLTINQPLGLNFGSNVGDIAVNSSSLGVNRGKNFGLFGGNINISAGQIFAPGGRIELGSFIQTGQIKFNNTENTTILDLVNIPPDLNRGNITLANGTNLFVQSEEGGNIGIVSGNLALSDGELGASFIIGGILTGSSAVDTQAGDVVIDVTKSIVLTRGSSILNTVGESTRGNAGNIKIFTNDLAMQDGSAVSASNFGIGNAGKITIEATGDITADGESAFGFVSGIFSLIDESVVGNSGGIEITADRIFLTNGGEIIASNLGKGNAGAITIEATGDILAQGEASTNAASGIFSTIEESVTGNAGGINITARNIFLEAGGEISSSNLGLGNAGGITINATEDIIADGESSLGFDSGIFSTIEESVTGNAGGIQITARNLTLTNGGEVSASTAGIGNAGSIAISTTGNIFVAGKSSSGFASGVFNTVLASGEGDAGGIQIAANNLSLADGGQISVASFGEGNAGSLQVRVNSLSLGSDASLFASTPTGRGGNINLEIASNLTLENRSLISAQALEDADGGNINIDAEFVIAAFNRNNDIIASAERGSGGNIKIATKGLFGTEARSFPPIDNSNNIDASSQFGLDGTVAIERLDVNPTEALEELPAEIIDVTRLVAQNLCQQDRGSEFVITGKEGIAANPLQVRDGEIDEVDLVQPAKDSEDNTNVSGDDLQILLADINKKTETKPEITEAQEWIINDRGNLELIAQKNNINNYFQHKSNRICQSH